MAINNITQTISTIPEAAHRGVDVQTQFVIKQEDFQDHLQGTTVTELNTLKDQLNSRIGEINSTITTMNGYANTASAGASTATTKAGEASISASEALTSKNQAGTFATNSSNSATKASQWADNNYNVAVETGKYSAKHWSTVAQNATEGKVDKAPSTDNAIVRFDGLTGAVQNSEVIIKDEGNILFERPSGAAAIDLNTTSPNGVCPAIRWGDTTNGQVAYIRAQHGTGLIFGRGWALSDLVLDTSGSLLLTSGTGAIGYGAGAGGSVTQLTSKGASVTLNKPSGIITTHNSALAAGETVLFQLINSLVLQTDSIIVSMGGNVNVGNYSITPTFGSNGFFNLYIKNISQVSLSGVISIRFELIRGATA